MGSKREIVNRSHPALFYRVRVTSSAAGQRDSLHLAILGTEPVFCKALELAAAFYTPFGHDFSVSWQTDAPAVLMPGFQVVVLDRDELVKRLRNESRSNFTQATVLLSMVHGDEEPFREVALTAYADIREHAFTFTVGEFERDDPEAVRLRSWWKRD